MNKEETNLVRNALVALEFSPVPLKTDVKISKIIQLTNTMVQKYKAFEHLDDIETQRRQNCRHMCCCFNLGADVCGASCRCMGRLLRYWLLVIGVLLTAALIFYALRMGQRALFG